MDFECFKCGEVGHFSRDCPSRPSRRPWETPRRDKDEQARINEWGVALCRMALAERGKTKP